MTVPEPNIFFDHRTGEWVANPGRLTHTITWGGDVTRVEFDAGNSTRYVAFTSCLPYFDQPDATGRVGNDIDMPTRWVDGGDPDTHLLVTVLSPRPGAAVMAMEGALHVSYVREKFPVARPGDAWATAILVSAALDRPLFGALDGPSTDDDRGVVARALAEGVITRNTNPGATA